MELLRRLIRRLLHPRSNPDPDYLVEGQRDPYLDSLIQPTSGSPIFWVTLDCE